MNKIIAFLFLGLFLISFVSADQFGFGKVGAGSGQVVIIANATINQTFYIVNNSFFNASYAPYTYVNEVVLGNASGGSMDYPYVNDNILGNKTDLYINLTNYVIANYIAGNNITINALIGQNTSLWNEALNKYNASYLSTYNSTYDNFWLSNTTIWNAIADKYNVSYLSTYNVTYDGFTSINNQSVWAGINAITGGNGSWNETRAFQLFVPYSGATGNVDLGNWNLTSNELRFNSPYIYSTDNYINYNNLYLNTLANITYSLTKNNNNSLMMMSISGNNTTLSLAPNSYLFGKITGVNTSIVQSGSTGGFAVLDLNAPNTKVINGANLLTTMFATVGTLDKNSTLEANSIGSTITGYIRGSNTNYLGANSGGGNYVLGYIYGGTNAEIRASPSGSSSGATFVQGYIGTSTNGSISATGSGCFVKGYITGNNERIICSGVGGVVIGMYNMSVSGLGSIGLGQNINISGANSMAIGLGSPLMQHINNSRVFAVMTGAVGINITNPNATLDVFGTAKVSKQISLTNVTYGLNSGESNVTQYVNSTGCLIMIAKTSRIELC